MKKELIESGEGTAMDRAKAVLGRAISFEKKQGSENLVMLMWDMMPHVLARYSSRDKHLKDVNVSNFMQLACLSLPSKPNMTAIVRSAGFLTSILARHRNAGNDVLVTLEVAAIQLALYLLCMSVEMKDMRVLTMYINQENFLQVVSSSIEVTEPLRTIPSLRLLLHIAQYQYDHQTKGQLQLKNGQSMEIKGMQILVLLASQNLVIMQLTLQLLYILLINHLPQPAFKIQLRGTETISSSFVQVLFKQLQFLCVQNHSSIPRNGWKCLGAVLHYTSDRHPDPSLLPILATQPWTHLLFIVALLPTSPKLGCEFLYFLCWWLQHYITKNTGCNPNLRSKSKAAYPNLFSTSVTNISKRLLIDEDANPMEKQLRLLAMVRILLTNADLPEDVEKELRLKLQQSNFKPQDCSITILRPILFLSQ
ncbi:uncharacterized protein [Anabrus simplex]|uniref:uncharacterized protein n=1 Tax=Anabrus simplex TaxID=316456 RepID=UPI0035A3BF7E